MAVSKAITHSKLDAKPAPTKSCSSRRKPTRGSGPVHATLEDKQAISICVNSFSTLLHSFIFAVHLSQFIFRRSIQRVRNSSQFIAIHPFHNSSRFHILLGAARPSLDHLITICITSKTSSFERTSSSPAIRPRVTRHLRPSSELRCGPG